MSIGSKQHQELLWCVARNLLYFEWIEANKTGYLDYHLATELERSAFERFGTDALFHAKVMALVQDIEFVLMDPISAERRRQENSLRYARLIDGFPR